MSRLLWRLALAAVLTGGAMPAWAQPHSMTLAPSEAMRCLTPSADLRGLPEYPARAYTMRQAGHVQVELEFDSPASAPTVRVVSEQGGSDFVEAVRAHVRDWRVPCLQSRGLPARLIFDFVFKEDDRRVYRARASDASDEASRTMSRCIKWSERALDYPSSAARALLQGRLLLELVFAAPDQPPEVNVHAPGPIRRAFGRAVEGWADGARMPCHSGPPIRMFVTYVFRIDGEGYGFMPGLTFNQLFRLMASEDRARIPRDTVAMGCPFDVMFQYRQPFLPNDVGQKGSFDAAREAFLDWLRSVKLKLADASLNSIYGDSVVFEVPCFKIDPNPNPGVTQ